MSAKFLDTNVLVYLAAREPTKASIAERLLSERPTISAQVLNELTDVSRRKLRFSWDELDELLDVILALTTVVELSADTNKLARLLGARYTLPFYDALILAAAMDSGCKELYSEDFQHGQKIGDLTIVNPFLPSGGAPP